MIAIPSVKIVQEIKQDKGFQIFRDNKIKKIIDIEKLEFGK